jgi:RNA polymerase sigma factor (sigma-70 family)
MEPERKLSVSEMPCFSLVLFDVNIYVATIHPMNGPTGNNPNFTTTNWGVVLEAGRTDYGRAARALEELCVRYWYPVYAFIRRRGSDHHEAKDLAQAFFVHLLENETLKKIDRQKGKFRSFLLTAATNFLTNEWDKRQSLKRGGQHEIISLDDADAEERYRHEPATALTPENLYDRRWAFTLLSAVLADLKTEYAAANKAELFAKLESGLIEEVNPGLYAGWAAALNMSEGAVRVAVHRLRRRFGELLRGEVVRTVTTPAEVDDEIRHLFAAIAS